jgi:hypothetical protein
MRRFLLVGRVAAGAFGLTVLAGLPLMTASAHEGHQAACTDTMINATKADIQAMQAGEGKTKATQEMQMAEEMMAKKDMDGCVAHLHKAMEAVEE